MEEHGESFQDRKENGGPVDSREASEHREGHLK